MQNQIDHDYQEMIEQQANHYRGRLVQAGLDHTEIPFLILDRQKQVIGATSTAAAIIGESVADMIDKPLSACGGGLFSQRDPTTVELPLMALLEVTERGPLAASGKIIRDQHGDPMGWIITLHDATVPQARRQRRTLPILPILQPYFVGLQQLMMTIPSLVLQQDAHQSMVIQLQRLLNEMILQVQRMVLLQSIEAQGEPKMERIMIGKMIQHVLLDVRADAHRRGVVLSMDIAESITSVECNPSQMRMALRELVENVLHHAHGCNEAWVRVYQRQGFLNISVSDNGHGISKEEQLRLLGPFSNDEQVRKERYDRIGFGLALVQAVARAHRGTMRIESVIGIGSTFTISIAA